MICKKCKREFPHRIGSYCGSCTDRDIPLALCNLSFAVEREDDHWRLNVYRHGSAVSNAEYRLSICDVMNLFIAADNAVRNIAGIPLDEPGATMDMPAYAAANEMGQPAAPMLEDAGVICCKHGYYSTDHQPICSRSASSAQLRAIADHKDMTDAHNDRRLQAD